MNPAGNRDARFADPAWQRSPLYRRLGQAYLTAEQAITALAGRAGPDWRTRERARLAASLLTSALAPTNTLPGNPAALRRAAGTGGHSLLRGPRNLLADVRAGRRVPGQADTRPFRLGENLGATPGAVVFRNDLLELIQYSPATPQVHSVPLLMVWSLINRYYILDLAPGRSFIEHAVGQGIEVFATSWRNPGREHAGWDLDRYAAAPSPGHPGQPAFPAPAAGAGPLCARTVSTRVVIAAGRRIRIAVRPGPPGTTPPLLCNGIGPPAGREQA